LGKGRDDRRRRQQAEQQASAGFGGLLGGAVQDAMSENMQRAQRYRGTTALIQQLPADGEWTKREREQWLKAVKATIDYEVKLVPEDFAEGVE
jgi:hypothetical protein